MEIKHSDKVQIKASVARVSKFSTDLRAVSKCIPDAKDFKQIDDKSFTMNVDIGISIVRGTFGVKCSVVEIRNNHAVYNIEGSGIGSSAKITLSLDLKEKGKHLTEVDWSADARLEGLVSGVSEGIIRKISEEKIEEIIINIKKSIEEVDDAR